MALVERNRRCRLTLKLGLPKINSKSATIADALASTTRGWACRQRRRDHVGDDVIAEERPDALSDGHAEAIWRNGSVSTPAVKPLQLR